MFKVNNKDTRMTPITSFWCVNFENTLHLILVFLLLTLKMYLPAAYIWLQLQLFFTIKKVLDEQLMNFFIWRKNVSFLRYLGFCFREIYKFQICGVIIDIPA